MDYAKERIFSFKDRVMAYNQLGLILVLLALFIGLAYYVYSKFVAPRFSNEYIPNKEYINKKYNEGEGEDGQLGKTAKIIFFWASWCPHSKTAKPEWDKIVEYYTENKNVVNGYRLIFEDVNCDNPDDPDTVKMLSEFKIEGYPTIKMVKGNEVIEYNANTDLKTVIHFVNSVLQ